MSGEVKPLTPVTTEEINKWHKRGLVMNDLGAE
jgi:hypothetical protein